MGELFKVGWDLFTIRHYSRQGMKLSAGDYAVAIGSVIFLYATAVPAAVLYQNHPQYKWVLIVTSCSTESCSSRCSCGKSNGG